MQSIESAAEMKTGGAGADVTDGQEPLANDIIINSGDTVVDQENRKRGRGESSSPPVAGNFPSICD